MLNVTGNSGIKRSREHLAQCESVRGLAILLVFAFHFLGDVYGYKMRPDASYLSSFLFGGDTGVSLFFVLSGFLLTLPFFSDTPLKLGEYLRNRALRILPMYYLMVLVAGWWTGQWQQVPRALAFQELKISELFPMGAVWWSLVVEIQFYLLLPCIVLLAQHKSGRWLLLPLLAAGIHIYWQISQVPLDQLNQLDGWVSYRNTLLGRWPLFGVGAMLAWVHVWLGPRLQTSQLASRRWPGSLVLLLALLLLAVILHQRVAYLGAFPAHALWFSHYVLEAIGWGIFLFTLLHLRPLGSALLVNPVFNRIGLWSYSLYLVHTSVLFLVGGRIVRKLGPLSDNPQLLIAVGLGLLALSCVISAATYHLVERPFLNLKKRRWHTVASPVQG
ncbi:acyltransferase family protein [Pseudomonas sp. QL9]|uniref:acyltransferase family protein n=1 Tax=Pseudomonas TaxID=286 RepID=UPI001363C7D0|nr:acyltransferase [Pseudomonas knackmussii]